MQYLSPSHQTWDLNSSHSFVGVQLECFIHTPPVISLPFFPIKWKGKNVKTTFYTNMLKYDIIWGRNERWVYFSHPIKGLFFCQPLTQRKKLYVPVRLPSGRTTFQLSKQNVLKWAFWHLLTSRISTLVWHLSGVMRDVCSLDLPLYSMCERDNGVLCAFVCIASLVAPRGIVGV